MHVHAVRFGRRGVITGHIFMMITGFVVVVVMMIMMVRIQSNSVDGIARIVVMLMGMSRRGRNEAIACKGKRQAEAHEAPGKRHGFRLETDCCILLNEPDLSHKGGGGNCDRPTDAAFHSIVWGSVRIAGCRGSQGQAGRHQATPRARPALAGARQHGLRVSLPVPRAMIRKDHRGVGRDAADRRVCRN